VLVIHSKHAELVDDNRHKNVRGDEPSGERSGADLVHEHEARDHSERADDAAKRRPPRHILNAFGGRKPCDEAFAYDLAISLHAVRPCRTLLAAIVIGSGHPIGS
jgi:hypothetical protein